MKKWSRREFMSLAREGAEARLKRIKAEMDDISHFLGRNLGPADMTNAPGAKIRGAHQKPKPTKVHWSQTPAGRKKLSESSKKRWATERRQKG